MLPERMQINDAVGKKSTTNRLDGLDIARYIAFVGMVVVNFKIAMGAESEDGFANLITTALEGRAAATFVVLAGIGLGLAGLRGIDQAISVTVKRAAFLLVLGLLNMMIFDADILHYYAFYFLFGVFLLPLRIRTLIAAIVGLNAAFVIMIFVLNYDAGWNWENYTYQGFWTVQGFVRNLFFNGWHPVIPWLGFLLFGLILSRLKLSEKKTQYRLIFFGALSFLLAEMLAMVLQPLLSGVDAELLDLATTEPVPPMPLYTLAGMGAASIVIGLCLRFTETFRQSGLLTVITPAGRQTLTLYIAHILIGMGVLEALGMLENQTVNTALIASMIFCLAATIFALLWARLFKRGLIETMMRKLAG